MYRSYRRRSILLSPIMIIGIITLILLAMIYFGGVLFFQDKYLPNTTVGGVECGLKNYEFVEKENATKSAHYSLLITDRKENLYVIEAKEFGYKYVNLGEEKQIMESQSPFAWPIALFQPSSYTLGYSVTYDEEKLIDVINHLGIFSEKYIEKPVDAYLDIQTDGYAIIPEKIGNEPVAEQIRTEILNAVKFTATTLTLSDDCYVAPKIHSSSADLLTAASQIDTYLNAVITYNFWDVQEVFGREQIMSAIKVSSNFEVTLDTKVFDKFAQYLASKYNTYADKREFKTAKGDTILIGGGDYGWVVDKTKESSEIFKNITSGAPVTREPIWSQTAKADGPNDIGNTYIEIDYTNQTVYLFKEGEKVFTSKFVSGNVKKGWASPDGIYDINYKDSVEYRKGEQITLKGEDYESKVDYFVVWARNIGFHDASWRKDKEFGGTTYLDDGSHGCINMPYDKVKQLFSLVSNGTPVVAYYRTPVEVYLHEYAFSYVKPTTETTE